MSAKSKYRIIKNILRAVCAISVLMLLVLGTSHFGLHIFDEWFDENAGTPLWLVLVAIPGVSYELFQMEHSMIIGIPVRMWMKRHKEELQIEEL